MAQDAPESNQSGMTWNWEKGKYSMDGYEIELIGVGENIVLTRPFWSNFEDSYDHGYYTLQGERVRISSSAYLSGPGVDHGNGAVNVHSGEEYQLSISLSFFR